MTMTWMSPKKNDMDVLHHDQSQLTSLLDRILVCVFTFSYVVELHFGLCYDDFVGVTFSFFLIFIFHKHHSNLHKQVQCFNSNPGEEVWLYNIGLPLTNLVR